MRAAAAAVVCLFGLSVGARAQCVSLTALGSAYTQNFDTLANSGTTNTLLPVGWQLIEGGGGARDNEQYAADNGSSNTGDTYSYGATGSTERAFGTLRSGTLIPTIGACFTNSTGSTITSLQVSYTGEMWRLGTTGGRTDQLDFQISTNATGLTTGTYTDVNALDFVTPNTTGATAGARDGNAAGFRTAVSDTISGLSIANGATFYIRWSDFDASGADDGLAVDDFSLTPQAGGAPPLTISNASPLPAGTVGSPYSVTFSATGGSGSGYTFAVTGGTTPGGLTFASPTLSGTPNAAGPFNFTVQVTDSALTTATKTFDVTINPSATCTPTTTISQIQGSGATSPLAGQTHTVVGIVTGLRTNSFYIQSDTADADADSNTSEGLLAFTNSAPPAAAAVGNKVCVTGTVVEFVPSASPGSQPVTEFSPVTSVAVVSTGNPLPAAVTLTPSGAVTPLERLQLFERFEGMRVSVSSLRVVAPTNGNVTESSATSTSNGVFYGVIEGTARPFREAGVQLGDTLPAGSPANVPRFDVNPERVRVDSDGLVGGVALNLNTGTLVNNLVGVLDYSFRTYTLYPDPALPPVVASDGQTLTAAVAAPSPAASELTVASYNLERFYDLVDDSGGDTVLTAAAFNNRLNKASLGIRNVLRMPDVLAVVEMENLATLTALANRVNADAVAASQPNPNYQAYLVDGNDPGLIDVGFLVKDPKVTVVEVVQVGKDATYIDPNSGNPATLNDRPPLVLRGTVTRDGSDSAFPFTVVVNHLRSLSGIDNPADPADAARIRAKRRAQAEYLANLLQARNATENVISVGDYNAFEVNDGYVDSMGTIKGAPTPLDQVVLASADLVTPDFVNLTESLPALNRYSYSFDGNAQTLDHVLINTRMQPRLSRYTVARLNADFAETLRNNANTPERLSDHDVPVAYFNLPLEVTSKFTISRSGLLLNRLTQTWNGTITLVNTSGQTVAGPVHVVLNGLNPAVVLQNANGTIEGKYYLTTAGPIGPGQSATLTVRFQNPTNQSMLYSPKVYSVNF